MKNNIDVSIVIAAWNSQDFILTAINSALSQKGVNIEVIVVDDFSTDSTCEVVESISDGRVKLYRSKENGGPGAARNIGFSAAQGKWIAVLDSDDTMDNFRLKNMLDACTETSDIVIDNFCEMDINGNLSDSFYSKSELPVGELALAFLLDTNKVFTNNKSTGYVKPLFNNSFIKANSILYWPEVRIGEDYYFLASCLAKGAKAEVLDQTGYVYTIRKGSISRVMEAQHVKKLLTFDEKFNQLYQLTQFEKIAQTNRTLNLSTAFHYLIIVEKIKSKKLFSAIIDVIKHPLSAKLLMLPIMKRLKFN